eukprot:1818229-Amphidinium_carterae.1
MLQTFFGHTKPVVLHSHGSCRETQNCPGAMICPIGGVLQKSGPKKDIVPALKRVCGPSPPK